ncbi:MAG: hypothetical protein ACFFD4_39335 [Candidatus Odinarchaeota archaeon]
MDKFLRETSIGIFGFDFLSKHIWNISNRVQLLQMRFVFEKLLIERLKFLTGVLDIEEHCFFNPETDRNEKLLKHLLASYLALGTITNYRDILFSRRKTLFLSKLIGLQEGKTI